MLFATCTAPESYPEQINLQIAAPDTVVVSFITFEPTLCGNGRHSEDEHSSIPRCLALYLSFISSKHATALNIYI